jgi:hypothetical protein
VSSRTMIIAESAPQMTSGWSVSWSQTISPDYFVP